MPKAAATKKTSATETVSSTIGAEVVYAVPKEVTTALDALASAVKSLEVEIRVMRSEVLHAVKQETPTVTIGTKQAYEAAPTPPVATPVNPSAAPFPVEWRAIIDSVLNSRFGAEVEYLPNASFQLTINVPKEYSNMTSREWDTHHADLRSKVIGNHLGSAGVREYVELIANNLGPEIRAKVADDRVKFVA